MVLKEKQRFKNVNFHRYNQVNLLQGMEVLLHSPKFYPAKRRKQNSWNLKETFISSWLTYLSITIYNCNCCEEKHGKDASAQLFHFVCKILNPGFNCSLNDGLSRWGKCECYVGWAKHSETTQQESRAGTEGRTPQTPCPHPSLPLPKGAQQDWDVTDTHLLPYAGSYRLLCCFLSRMLNILYK